MRLTSTTVEMMYSILVINIMDQSFDLYSHFYNFIFYYPETI